MKRSNHDLSFGLGLTGDFGELHPICAQEVLPGDSYHHKISAFLRIAPMAKPIMHPVDVRIHTFYVPNRLLWSDWEEFIVGNVASHTYPTITPGSAADTVLYDRMGVEPVTGVPLNALPIRAYNMIWNEFFRDQDLGTERNEDALTLARIAWGKDYFTTARDEPQQGTAATVAFSSGEAPLINFAVDTTASTVNKRPHDETDHDGVTAAVSDQWAGMFAKMANTSSGAQDYDSQRGPVVDLSGATGGISWDDIRQAAALTRLAEARARYGSRYVDYLRFYGINPSDGRLDRPEYLGGGSKPIQFSEVLSTAEGATVEVGELFGHGMAGVSTRPYRKFFEEHGWCISLMSIRPRGIYQNGIPRKFMRDEPSDFWHKELELLPWQTVDNREVYGAGTAGTWGYVPRFDEYRENMSYVAGQFRNGGTEEDWHLAREFASQPTLNESFVTCTPSDRIFQDVSIPEFEAQIWHDMPARRLVAKTARGGSINL